MFVTQFLVKESTLKLLPHEHKNLFVEGRGKFNSIYLYICFCLCHKQIFVYLHLILSLLLFRFFTLIMKKTLCKFLDTF
jgi:hypothetical protein